MQVCSCVVSKNDVKVVVSEIETGAGTAAKRIAIDGCVAKLAHSCVASPNGASHVLQKLVKRIENGLGKA